VSNKNFSLLRLSKVETNVMEDIDEVIDKSPDRQSFHIPEI